MDGISNAFIKTFWEYFRVPTYKYAIKCFETGSFTPTFSNGSIRLIPKKGDSSKIKNWRPISLLNCFYKLISRAVNTRLQKASDRIISRAQKCFTSARYIQEVLINVIENISYCNKFNLPGSIVAIDEAKAFDSLNHTFMKETWKFFGFGQQMSKMLNTIVENRSSCIIFGNNTYSRNFRIETGAMQGDGPSPLIFDFNQQILIFKLEFDPKISSCFINSLVPRPINNPVLGPGADPAPPDPVTGLAALPGLGPGFVPDPAPLVAAGPVPNPTLVAVDRVLPDPPPARHVQDRVMQIARPNQINQLATFPVLFPGVVPFNY